MLNLEKIKTTHVLLLGLFVYALVLILNDGLMALDEYWVGVIRYIPAQVSSVQGLIGIDDVKSPLQLLPMYWVAQLSLALGVTDPYWQYRAVISVLSVLNISVLFYAFIKFSKVANLGKGQTNLLLLMLIFYFAAPFTLTRPMFESIAAPWLTLAAVWGYWYDRDNKLSTLLWAVLFVSICFVLRQQLGICALAFVILPLLKKKWNHFLLAGAFGLFLFILSGIPDYFIRGSFHESLIKILTYNYEHGSEYGNQSVLFYPAVIFVILLIPFFIKKYSKDFLKSWAHEYRIFLWVVGLFVFLHSLFPQKWERFLISIIPILLILLYPFLEQILQKAAQHKVRLVSLLSFNMLLFFVASFFPAQKNLIDMSRYLGQHPEIKQVHRLEGTPEWITEAFIQDKKFEFVESTPELLAQVDWTDCGQAVVVGHPYIEKFQDLIQGLKLNGRFNVNVIEQLAFKMNPTRNLRRVELLLYSGCER